MKVVEPVNTGGGLFRDSLDLCGHAGVELVVELEVLLQNAQHNVVLLRVILGWLWDAACGFKLNALVNQECRVSAVIKN